MVVGGEGLVLDALHLQAWYISVNTQNPSSTRSPDTNLGAQSVDPRVGGDRVRVVLGGQATKDERNRDHVLDRVVTVGKVVQRARLVNDADLHAERSEAGMSANERPPLWQHDSGPYRGLLRADLDVLDVVRRLAHVLELLVHDVRSLGGRLGV